MNQEDTSFNNSNEKINIFSTLLKNTTQEQNHENNQSYCYLVRVVIDCDEQNSGKIEEHYFHDRSLIENKMSARLFFDTKLFEFDDCDHDDQLQNENTLLKNKVELYLVLNHKTSHEEKLLLVCSNNGEQNANKLVESKILNGVMNQLSKQAYASNESVITQNTFLDSIYKD